MAWCTEYKIQFYGPLLTRMSGSVVVPEIDRCIGEGLESVLPLTEAIEAKQQSAESVFPGEHTFNRTEALGENGGVGERLTSSRLPSFSFRPALAPMRTASLPDRGIA
jgi:hypothetical protein